jgi:major membrane immunogen (membrane-anchored lipoprotein)
MRKTLALIIILLFVLLTACGTQGAYKDGNYTKNTDPDSHGSWYKCVLSIKDGKIADVQFTGYTRNADGTDTIHDQNYGKYPGSTDQQYQQAQTGLAGSKTYGPKLVQTQDLGKVDVVAGATQSWDVFKAAMTDLLSQAKK